MITFFFFFFKFLPSGPFFEVWVAAVISRTPPADGSVLQGSLLERRACLGEQRLLMGGDDGPRVALGRRLLSKLLQARAGGLGDQLRVRRLVWDQLLGVGGQSGDRPLGWRLGGVRQRGGWRQRSRWRRVRGHGQRRGACGAGSDHRDGDDRDGHGGGRWRCWVIRVQSCSPLGHVADMVG